MNVTFNLDESQLPEGVEDDEIREWLEYELGRSPQIQLSNPLVDTQLEAKWISISRERPTVERPFEIL